jgi:formate hydrogenlyase subunit 3/multisubunit Na+/H+ antiporter MnhD subunit
MKTLLGKVCLFIIGSLIALLVMYSFGYTKPEEWVALVVFNMLQAGMSLVKALETD